MSNSALTIVTAPDYDNNKAALQAFLANNAQLSDYNFTGSNLTVLQNLLAYNTFLNQFFTNMSFSEMFLDSTQLPASAASRAAELNYVPRSYTSSEAVINAVFAQSNLTSFEIPALTQFTGMNSNGTYSFVTNNDIVLYPSNGYFYANNLTVYEGSVFQDSYVVNSNIPQNFTLSVNTADTASLTVYVNNTVFTQAENTYGLNGNSTIYYLEAFNQGGYKIVFGDGVLGYKPADGSVVVLQYRACNGTDGNGSTNLILNTNLGSFNGYGSAIIPTISMVATSFNGSNNETIESIKLNAPRHYATQENAVTADDYQDIITQQFPFVKNIFAYTNSVYNYAVSYGTVLLPAISVNGTPLTTAEKNSIQTYLKNKSFIGFDTVIIDPDYLYLSINSDVTYDPNVTNASPTEIQSEVISAIQNYSNTYLTDFNTTLEYSKFCANIDSTDTSISDNETTVTMFKTVTPLNNNPASITANFSNPINPGSVVSTPFTSNGSTYQFTDLNPFINTFQFNQTNTGLVITNSSNNIYLYNTSSNNAGSYRVAGKINYSEGMIQLNSISITSNSFNIFATASEQNISTTGNQVLTISNITVNTATI